MHPYLFHIPLPWGGTFRAASYGLMVLCGFLICLWLAQRRGKRFGINPLDLFDAAVVTLLSGIVGARLFYVAENWSAFADSPLRIVRLDLGGLAFFGGLVGGTLGLLAGLRWKRLPMRTTLDVAAGLLPLGHAFGRVGCFLNGCCFGRITESWVGMRFPAVIGPEGELLGSPPFLHHLARGLVTEADRWSLPVHPTQLYAVIYNLAIFAVLSLLLRRRRRAGEVAWLYPILYGTARFCNEFLRADTPGEPALGGLTVWQGIAALVVVFGVVMMTISRRRPSEPLPEPWHPTPKEG